MSRVQVGVGTPHVGALLARASVVRRDPQLLNVLLIVAIVAADWVTPAGVAVGILLAVPIVLSAMRDDRPAVIGRTAVVAATGYVLAGTYGFMGEVPMQVWLSNRVMVILGLVVMTGVAYLVQRTRVQALEGRDSALAAKDLNRLLMSLLAHDLRSPLTVASQGFKYVEDALADGRPIDPVLLADVRARLRRSLRAIDVVLSLARAELPRDTGEASSHFPPSVRVDGELRAEVDSFEEEAAVRGKLLRLDFARVEGQTYSVDGLVLRQVIAILLDNAVRHALPGPVTVSTELAPPNLVVRVRDSGPGLSAHRAQGTTSTSGMGIGLELCRTLVTRAGGTLDIECDGPDGTCFRLQLPAQRLPEHGIAEQEAPSANTRAHRASVVSR